VVDYDQSYDITVVLFELILPNSLLVSVEVEQPMASHEVLCPIPGIFYRQASPESEPFKVAGQAVHEADVIGLVEVMKQFHEVRAGATGTLKDYVVENESEVSPGQLLALVET